MTTVGAVLHHILRDACLAAIHAGNPPPDDVLRRCGLYPRWPQSPLPVEHPARLTEAQRAPEEAA